MPRRQSLALRCTGWHWCYCCEMADDAAVTPNQTTVALYCQHWAVNVRRRTKHRCRWYSFQAERQLQERRQVVRCSDAACYPQTYDDVLHDTRKCHRHLLHIEQTRADVGHRTAVQCHHSVLPAYTTCLRLLRKSATQLRALPLIPNHCLSTSMRTERSMVSKAADSSNSTKALMWNWS